MAQYSCSMYIYGGVPLLMVVKTSKIVTQIRVTFFMTNNFSPRVTFFMTNNFSPNPVFA